MFLFHMVGHTQQKTFGGWLVSTHKQSLARKWGLFSDLQVRSANRFSHIEAVLIRPAVRYKLTNKHSVAVGYAYLGNWEWKEAEKTFELEHRIWEQFLSETKLGKSEMTNRIRLEQRFLHQNGGVDYAQRLRYYLRFEVPLTRRMQDKTGVFVGLQNELFLNIQNKERVNDKIFDQNRAFAGIGYRFSEKLDIEGGYLYRHQIEEDKVHNHILQVTVTTSL